MNNDTYAMLHIEQMPGEQMNLKLKGDPAVIAKMVATAMRHSQTIAAAIIAPVIEYCQQEGFHCGDLEKMVKCK
jgi:hypothetical protein